MDKDIRADDAALLDAYSNTVAGVVDRVGPAVSRIERVGGRGGHGSGFVISPDGLIVTNYHVIEDAKSVRIAMPDGFIGEGRVLGRDPDTDIALVRADGSPAHTRRSAIPNDFGAARSPSRSATLSAMSGP